MASGRFVSATIATDAKLSRLSLEAEYLFLKAIPHLDRDGLILADVLWATVAPRRPALAGLQDVCWQEWVRVGLCTAYETDEGTVLFFHGFARNQAGMRYDRETPSRYDVPPGYVRGEGGLVADGRQQAAGGKVPEECRSDSGSCPAVVGSDAGSGPAQQQQQQQQQDQVQDQDQQQQQQQGEDEPAELFAAAVACAFDQAEILPNARGRTAKDWHKVTGEALAPADVLAWDKYRRKENVHRNGNALRPAFVVSELRAGRRAPPAFHDGPAGDQHNQPRVLE